MCEVASERGLLRTLLRGLALSMVVGHCAGRGDQVLARLVEFLRRNRQVGYFRPLVRHAGVSRTALRTLLDTDVDKDVRRAAEASLLQLSESRGAPAGIFSERELEVLAGVRDGLRNKDIGSRLGITEEGVRYHLRNIYRKTGAGRREDVLRYAPSDGAVS